MKKEFVWEIVAVSLVVIVMLFMGAYNLWQGQLVHDYPTGYLAQDGYIFFSNQYYLNESGSWQHISPALVRGETNIIQSQPPIFYHLSAMLGNLAGIEYYDSSYITAMFLIICAALCFYFVIRAYNKDLALLCLPFNVLLFSGVWLLSFAWGRLPFFTGCSMVVLALWCMTRYNEHGTILFFGSIAIAASAMTHTSELILLLPLLMLFITLELPRKNLLKMLILGVIIASPYLLIFEGTFMKGTSLSFITPSVQGLGMFAGLLSAGWIIAVIIGLGLLFGLKHFKSKVAVISYYFFLIGFAYFIGLGKRAIEERYMWTIYLSIFFGMFFYEIFRKFEHKHWYAMISCALTLILAFSFYTPVNTASIVSESVWDSMQWLQRTPWNSRVLYHGDFWQAGVMFGTRRITDVVAIEELIGTKNVTREILVQTVNDRTSDFPTRTGWFSFGSRLDEDLFAGKIMSDLCSYQYHALKKLKLNAQMVEWLANNTYYPIYQNNEMVIMQGGC